MSRSIAATLLIAVLCGAPPAFGQCPAPTPPGSVLSVTGSATVSEKPDVAVVRVTLTTRGATLAGTTQAHAARVAQATAALEALKAEGVTVEQGSFSIGEERLPITPGAQAAPPQPPRFLARTNMDLRVKNLDRLDGILGRLAEGGLFEVNSTVFALRDESEALDRARRGAMADARHQAETYADAAGVRLDGILSIADGAAQPSQGAFDLPVRAPAPASVGVTPPETLRFSRDVSVTWRIAPR